MRHQRGAALMAMLALLVGGAAWWTVTAVSSTINRTAEERAHNARVLQEAKSALIGYVAQQTAGTSDDPGRLPCPEAAGNIGTANEGIAAGNCTLPAVGRLPWRTLGLDKWRDVAGEPLWYVVSPGWGKPNASTNTVINSNSTGQLTLDSASGIVALIIAPGRPLAVQASANCIARVQRRTTPSPAIDLRDYLECENATLPADASFASTGPAGSFNDQVLRVTAAELLPGIEAAIAKRIEAQIIPVLKAAYADAKWGTSTTNPVFAYAAPFSDPVTSSLEGQATPPLYRGLLPFNTSAASPALLTWGNPTMAKLSGAGTLYGTPTCYTDATWSYCEGYYRDGAVQARYDDPMNGVARALRDFNAAEHTAEVWAYNYNTGVWTSLPPSSIVTTRAFNADASLSFRITATLPSVGSGNWGYYFYMAGRPEFTDHSLLRGTNPGTGWFVRNQWHRLMYYAFAPGHAAGAAGSCVDLPIPTCLQVANIAPANKQRAIVLLAGRSLPNQSRPSANLADYLDSTENQNNDARFEQLKVGTAFNDRVIVVDVNP